MMTKKAKIEKFFTWIIDHIIPFAAVIISATTIYISITSNRISQSGLVQVEISNRIAQMELERAEFARPVIYELTYEQGDTDYVYVIRHGDSVIYIQAVELIVDVIMGAITSLTAFHYDGYILHYINTFEIPRDEIVTPTVRINMPLNPSHLIYEGIFYDYMFLLMTPVEGSLALYMFCVEVDIYNGELLRVERFNKYSLLELMLNTPISDARRHMLEAYYGLINQISALELR